MGAGIQTAAIAAGGSINAGPPTAPITADTELYNGSAWTEVNNLNSEERWLQELDH